MQQDQIPFTVMGYGFLQADQIDLILQEVMTTDWYNRVLPGGKLTIHADMRDNLDRNQIGVNAAVASGDFIPMKRVINFSLNFDRKVAPEIVEKIIRVFRLAFNFQMMAMSHGTKSDGSGSMIAATLHKVTRKRPPTIIEWESYPVKAVRHGRNN